MSEAELQKHVLGYARFYGWRAAHFHDSRREVVRRGQRQLVGDSDAAGFPDLVLIRPPELLFVELKSERGRPTDAQRAWLEDLDAVARRVTALVAGSVIDELELAVEVYLWRPSDLDAAHDRLARGRVRQEPLGAL